MTAEISRYLKQQTYNSNEITVSTPYLGQLAKPREALETHDRVAFGETDTLELGGQKKQPLEIATIGGILIIQKSPINIREGTDDYQGEENDVIIASLTRSNEEENTGFMPSPERLNVLLSRVCNGLIIIGNGVAFLKSRSGKEI